ncbi:MAG: hypothetical protein QXL01_00335 [Thermoplasmatales archaeon]
MRIDNERFVWLSWKLMECKLMYYQPDLVHPSWHKDLGVLDSQYDAWESEYLSLASKLMLEPTVCLMVGFDTERASSRLILNKYSKQKGKADGTLYEERT